MGRPRTADLSAIPASVGLARDLLHTWLRGHPCAEEAVQLASETVTNAVRHGSPADGSGVVRLAARWTSGRVYVAVTDDGAGGTAPTVRTPILNAVSGRGLLLVDAIASRWGFARVDHGRRRVWFELVAR